MKIKLIILFFSAISITGCKTDTDEPSESPTALILSASKSEIIADFSDYSVLKIEDNVGIDRTASSKIFVNNEEYSSTNFSTKTADNYTIHAELNNLVSNVIQIKATKAPIKFITLSCSSKEAYSDGVDEVVLRAFTDLNDDITSETQFYADDNLLTSNIYTSDKDGLVNFKASYQGFTDFASTTFIEKPTFVQRALLEDYTGTWCGYCPRVAYAIEDAVSKSDQIIAVAIHSGDPMEYEHVNSLMQEFNIEGFPTVIANRSSKWNEIYSSIAPESDAVSPIGIAINSSLNGRSANVTVNVKAISWYDLDLKLVVCLTENKVLYTQQNFYGDGNPIENFEHNHVLRKAFTDIYGDNLTNKNEDNVYESNFDVDINSNYTIENCDIVAFVTNRISKRIINVQKVKLGESIEF